MFKRFLLSGTLAISCIVSFSSALAGAALPDASGPKTAFQNTATGTSSVPSPITGASPAEVVLPASDYPKQALLKKIVDWLAARFGLPAIHDYPRIEFVSSLQIEHDFRNHGSAASETNAGASFPAAIIAQPQNVVAFYRTSSRTIVLADGWTGNTPSETSVLVHEMVHHLQNIGGLHYECPQAREKLAYQSQDEWLKQFGQDLQGIFEVDKLTILVRSSCVF
jgi:hypothetical protein